MPIVANFSGGNGTASPDQFAGIAGDGWANAWQSGVNSSTSITRTVISADPLLGGGNYLSIDFVSGGLPSAQRIDRQYTDFDDVVTTDPHQLSLNIRFDALPAAWNQISLFGRRTAHPNAHGGTSSDATWAAMAQSGGNWVVTTTGGTLLDTGIAVATGVVYTFVFSLSAGSTYTVAISEDGVPSYSSPTLDYRNTDLPGPGTFVHLHTGASSTSNTFEVSLDALEISPSGVVPAAPTLVAEATSWDAVRLAATAGADTDSIEIYRSLTSPVDPQTDPIVATLTPDGVVYDDSRTPAQTYFYLAVANNVSGSTNGTEQEITTWSDDAIETFVNSDSIEIPFVVPSGERATEIRLKAGTAIRDTSVESAVGALVVEVRDASNNLVGSDTFDNLPNDPDTELGELVVFLSPQPVGPQTITVTFTSSITL